MKEVDLYGKFKNIELLLKKKIENKTEEPRPNKNANPCHILQYIQK